MRTFIFILIFFILVSGNILSQVENKKITLKYWGCAGAGLTFTKFTNSDLGLALAGGICFDYRHNLLSLKYNHNYEIGIFISPLDELWSAELLYGRRMDFTMRGMCLPFFPFGLLIKREFEYSFNVFVGISVLGSRERREIGKDKYYHPLYSSENFIYIGFPAEIELVERFGENIGLGLSVYGNINESKGFLGVRSNLYFGFF